MSRPASGGLETALGHGDEARGRIVMRGRDLAQLAATNTYEEVVAILWNCVVPGAPNAEIFAQARLRAFERLSPFEAPLRGRSAAEAMRVLVAVLPAAAAEPALDLLAGVGVAAAAAVRSQDGAAWRAPDPALGHIADLLAAATGEVPAEAKARALERYCILMVEHGISASTYAARVAASTDAPPSAGALAALCVLQGLRHGGAPSLVLDQFDRISGPDDAVRFVADERAAGRRILGFGSRAYAGLDLRSQMMKAEWEAIGGATGRRADAEALEAALTEALAQAYPDRGLRTNVEYYAALLMEATGLPKQGFTPMFAAARSAGWIAHYYEQQAASSQIIRPASTYVGEWPED